MTERATIAEWKSIINEIQALEDRTHRAKMGVTAQALNKAKNTAGWELASLLQQIEEDLVNMKGPA
jgi:hypothetical protein